MVLELYSVWAMLTGAFTPTPASQAPCWVDFQLVLSVPSHSQFFYFKKESSFRSMLSKESSPR